MPLLFVVAIEPLAAIIRSNGSISGFQYGARPDKIMLYADDTMPLVGDTKLSLRTAMEDITKFGKFAGYLNWSKSSLMLLDRDMESTTAILHNIPVSSKFKYLGVYVSPKPLDYISLNLTPNLTK